MYNYSLHSVWLIFMAQKLGPHMVQYLPNTSHCHTHAGMDCFLHIDFFRFGIGDFKICFHSSKVVCYRFPRLLANYLDHTAHLLHGVFSIYYAATKSNAIYTTSQ